MSEQRAVGLDLGRASSVAAEYRHRRTTIIARQSEDLRRTSGTARRHRWGHPSVVAEAAASADRLLRGIDDRWVVAVVPAGTHETRRVTFTRGIDGIRTISAPMASALSWVATRPDLRPSGRCLFVDIGAGSASAATIEIEDGVYEVLAQAGDLTLGGDRWTERIVSWLVDTAPAAIRPSLATSGDELWRSAEQAKRQLTSATESQIALPGASGQSRPLRLGLVSELDLELRARLEALLLAGTPADAQPIDHLVVTGGGARSPGLASMIERFAGRPAAPIGDHHDLAHGAAIAAGVLTGQVKDLLWLDATATERWIDVGGARHLAVPRHTTFPLKIRMSVEAPAGVGSAVLITHLEQDHATGAPDTVLGQQRLELPAGRRTITVEVGIDANHRSQMNVALGDSKPPAPPETPSAPAAAHAGVSATTAAKPAAGPTASSTPGAEADTATTLAMLRSLLPVIDAVDAARAHGKTAEASRFAAALQVLDDLRVERIDGTSVAFDPARHEAIGSVDPKTSGTNPVVRVVRAGFVWNGILVRPALVAIDPTPPERVPTARR